MKQRYRFKGRYNGKYYWENVVPTDSRTEELSCGVMWFWGKKQNLNAST